MLGLKFGECLFQVPLKLKFCMLSKTDCCQYSNYHLIQNLWQETTNPVQESQEQ